MKRFFVPGIVGLACLVGAIELCGMVPNHSSEAFPVVEEGIDILPPAVSPVTGRTWRAPVFRYEELPRFAPGGPAASPMSSSVGPGASSVSYYGYTPFFIRRSSVGVMTADPEAMPPHTIVSPAAYLIYRPTPPDVQRHSVEVMTAEPEGIPAPTAAVQTAEPEPWLNVQVFERTYSDSDYSDSDSDSEGSDYWSDQEPFSPNFAAEEEEPVSPAWQGGVPAMGRTYP